MADGQFGNITMGIGAIIQVRYDSSRLPGKALLELPYMSGKSVLANIVERLQQIKDLKIIIATSIESSDDPIADEAEKLGVPLFRGSKDDVLLRFSEAAKAHDLHTVVRITGDNPIIFKEIIEKNIQYHINGEYDYTRNINMPYGTSFEIVSAAALEKILQNSNNIDDREHVTLYIKRNSEMFKIAEQNHFPDTEFPDVRLTVDYPSDYAALNIIMTYLDNLEDYNPETVFKFLAQNSWIKRINNSNMQKKQFNNLYDELNYAIVLAEQLDLKYLKLELETIKARNIKY
ncbi:acylneuraminate cytidylyltransferase [Flavobacterium salilacus subsp. salilacus]|uniref:cytidylyltransferase domain-containing protein n=1 Tax=Flavobacterium TaxID=237 RepID=UPI0010751D8B|nr:MULTISPECIES: glycosyltransferase family protein [Flavobacterium]KAF2519778.1 acylneuraminate cytidylyltransferase [Flavobacterium salilacus subsp. salilacus]MBE1614324.1 glycosyltransferase family protein [Flavobacterium sp. SaA2.13]